MATTSVAAAAAGSSNDATPSNARGIPHAPFVDRVEDYVTSRSEVEGTLRKFQEMIGKYQFMEQSTTRRLQGLREKVPDIRKTLDMVRFLQTRKKLAKDDEGNEDVDDDDKNGNIEATFELNDTLYAKAHVPPTDEVYLWLGANIMLMYPLDEASELLDSKLDGAMQKIADCEEDIDFLREQITTLEVATARVYNWDVGQRRKERDAAESSGQIASAKS